MSLEKFEPFIQELIKWNKSINLVQEKTINDIYNRHILDCLQLKKLLNKTPASIVDIGSGAGFPGLVLAIDTPFIMHLVEPVSKKNVFLNHIKNLYNLNVTIHNCRWQDVGINNAEIITSRAFAPLNNLLEAMEYVSRETKEARGLFLKGDKLEGELKEAQKVWQFEYEIYQSETHEKGKIISVRSLKRK